MLFRVCAPVSYACIALRCKLQIRLLSKQPAEAIPRHVHLLLCTRELQSLSHELDCAARRRRHVAPAILALLPLADEKQWLPHMYIIHPCIIAAKDLGRHI